MRGSVNDAPKLPPREDEGIVEAPLAGGTGPGGRPDAAAIEAGDMLVSASVPGYAKKAPATKTAPAAKKPGGKFDDMEDDIPF